ncbi:MAG: TIGR00730 family Rossman fold protein [Actinomycetota bacterium]
MSPADQSTTEPTSDLRAVCVYCASSPGNDPALAAAAVALGQHLAAEGIELVYGGGAVGLMGLIADTVMDAGGTVTGIIPTSLMPKEVAHRGLTELVEVTSMHARKAAMIERSDGFVALPGGFGTLEELAEVLTWSQLGLHAKPIGLVNVGGFYDDLLAFFDRAVADSVLKPSNRELLLTSPDPVELVGLLRHHRPVQEPKWTDLDQRL